MKHVHIECLPDEHLVKKLGLKRKYITHHQGKSRVFHALSKSNHQIAMVDEDPGSIKTQYEKSLNFQEEVEGIKCYTDRSGNRILYLKGKLEDWIISLCKKEKINLSKFGLPNNPDDLHDVINHKLSKFGNLLDELIKKKNPAIRKLRDWLS